MKLVFCDQQIPVELTKSLFLEGPSSHNPFDVDWRKQALNILQGLGFDGTVFIPVAQKRFYGFTEDAPGSSCGAYAEWRDVARQVADSIVCWFATDIDSAVPNQGVQNFVLNAEFSEDVRSGKFFYGRPDGADMAQYMDAKCERYGVVVHRDLGAALSASISWIGDGALRSYGEVYVPLNIWRTSEFQDWYSAMKDAGGGLDGVSMLNSTQFIAKDSSMGGLQVNVWSRFEDQSKTKQGTLIRNDVSAVLPYFIRPDGSIQLVLVKEFQAVAKSACGFAYEIPRIICTNPLSNPLEVVQDGLRSALGLDIEDMERITVIGRRETHSTFSTQKVNLYAVVLTEDEMSSVVNGSNTGNPFAMKVGDGTANAVVLELSEICGSCVDYSTLGMIFEIIKSNINI